MTRYRGTGAGGWRGDWYRYVPSVEDRLAAKRFGEAVAPKRTDDIRTGYGAKSESRPEWLIRGFLGEVAALHPLGYGPETDVRSRARTGRGDLGPLEVRTSGWHALRGGSAKWPGLGGWRITAKDRGRIIVCVEDRDDDLAVMGWAHADDIPRLAEPLGKILAVVEPSDLRSLLELAPYAGSGR